jgi:acyl-CoA thioesterase YciA
MAQVDLAGSVVPARHVDGRMATVAVNQFIFKQPVRVGDILSFFAEVTRIGNTSITVQVEVYAERFRAQGRYVKVTEASLTYVAIDDNGKPRPIPMLTGELRSKVDADLECLLVRRHCQPDRGDRADHLPALPAPPGRPAHAGRKQGQRAGQAHRAAHLPRRQATQGRDYDDLRWSRFKNFAPAEMFKVVGEHVFPFLRSLGGDGSTYATT